MKKWLVLLLLMALTCVLALTSCGDGDDTDGDVDGDEEASVDGDDEQAADGDDEQTTDGDDEQAADGDDEQSTDGDTEVEANPPAAGQTAASCQETTDCDDEYCANQTSLAELGLTIDPIEGGYCSALMCRTDGSGDKCLASYDFCFSLYPFKGDTLKNYGLCSRKCTSSEDCRPESDQSCWDLSEMVTSGLEQTVYDELYKDQHVCLPDSLIAVIKASIAASVATK